MAPRTMNYETTYFYKLCCKDVNITDIYVGHTTNFVQRRSRHKNNCSHTDYKEYYYKVYEFIRLHGGWENWDMILITKCSCDGILDAKQKERKYIEELNATLNINMPYRTQEEHKRYMAMYRENNKEHITEALKQYRNNNIDKLKEKNKQYREANREQLLERKKLYYQNNKDKAKQYRETHKDVRKEKRKIYIAENKDKINEQRRRRYAEKKQEIITTV